MSFLSELTGVHISPHGVHIEPLKALGTAMTVGSFGGLGPVAGALSHIPGAAAAGGALSRIPGAGKVGGFLAHRLGGSGGGYSGGSEGTGLPSDNEVWGSETAPDQGGGVGGYLKSALGGMNPLTAGLGALGVVNAGQLGAKANKYADQAMGDAQGSYAERAGLRQKGINDMLHPQVPDTSALTRIRSSNPYSGLPPAGTI